MKLKAIIIMLVAAIAGSNAAYAQFDLSKLGNILNNGTLTDVVNSLISTDKVEAKDLVGTWQSNGSAVSFKSEGLLEKAGGTAASAAVESKLNPYFKKAGLENFTLTVTEDQQFTFTLKSGRKITGTVENGTKEGTLIFNFGKVGTKNLGKITVYVNKGTQLSLLFDVSKLQNVVSTIASVSGNSTVGSISSLLKSYKGIYAGFKFTKK